MKTCSLGALSRLSVLVAGSSMGRGLSGVRGDQLKSRELVIVPVSVFLEANPVCALHPSTFQFSG